MKNKFILICAIVILIVVFVFINFKFQASLPPNICTQASCDSSVFVLVAPIIESAEHIDIEYNGYVKSSCENVAMEQGDAAFPEIIENEKIDGAKFQLSNLKRALFTNNYENMTNHPFENKSVFKLDPKDIEGNLLDEIDFKIYRRNNCTSSERTLIKEYSGPITYNISQPNGPLCSPTCHIAILEI
jgi:hypothetical protein